MRSPLFALPILAAIASAACGSNDTNGGAPDASTASDGGTPDEAAGGDAGADGAPVNDLPCSTVADGIHLAGRLASGAFDRVYHGSRLASPTSLNGSLDGDGEIEVATFYSSTGAVFGIGGALVLPSSGPEPGVAYCINAASISQSTDMPDGAVLPTKTTRVHAANIAALGSCANAPAPTDTLEICASSNGGPLDDGGAPDGGATCVAGKIHIVGTIGGKAVDVLVTSGTASVEGGRAGMEHLVMGLGDRGLALLDHPPVDASSQYDGTYPTTGLLFAPREASPDGDVMCIGAGSTATYTPTLGYRLTLRVSSLGKCAATTAGAFFDACVAD